MLTVSPYLLTLFTLSEISCYTLLNPKLYSQPLPSTNRAWSKVPYAFRSYQSSVPLQYYTRYVSEPYFAPPVQNSDYYISQDNYPYSSSFDDSDYYSNVLYYIPANRRIPYYDQPVIDPIEDLQDYDEDAPEEELIPKSQREWWLQKSVLPSEDADFNDFHLIDDIPSIVKEPKMPKKAKSKEPKKKPKNRYVGIDGFGRKKDKEQIYGTYRPSPRRDEERTWVYGVAIPSDYNEDQDVRELRSLLKEPRQVDALDHMNHEYDNSGLASWIVGNAKRNGDDIKNSNLNENSSFAKIINTLQPSYITFPIYNEAGIENIPIDYIQNDGWSENDNDEAEEPSVFDKIKRLLALEDKVNQQIKSKRSKDCDSENCEFHSEKESRAYKVTPNVVTETTTMKVFPDVTRTSTRKAETKNYKRSADKANKIVSDEESLVRQLSALRHITS